MIRRLEIVLALVVLAFLAGCSLFEGMRDGAAAELVEVSPPARPPGSAADGALYSVGAAAAGALLGYFIPRKRKTEA